jgi:hypothetical protein
MSKKIWIFLFCLFIFFDAFCQNNKFIPKLGGFFSYSKGFPTGYTISIEFEKEVNKLEFLSFSCKIDYQNISSTQAIEQPQNLFLSFGFKFYPFYWKHNIPCKGIFIGLHPTYLISKINTGQNRYGPGIGTCAGYQFLIKKKIYLSYELSMVYYQNLNLETYKWNDKDRYFEYIQSIKIGFRL